MYASQRNLLILVALLKKHGVRHAVISPGTRNMALAVSLENDPFFTTYSVVDERSAAYFAIGVSLAHGGPVLLSCTSAQATRNYLPGLTEAYYRRIPLVAVTADHRASKLGQGLMQVIDQMSIPRDSARASVQLPVVRDGDDDAYCVRLVNEALLGLNHHGKGPVHIDLTVDAAWMGTVPALPDVRLIERYSLKDDFPDIEGRNILIVVGQHEPFSDAKRSALDAFTMQNNVAVFVNHLSNYHGPRAVAGSLVVESMDARKFAGNAPDILITIGGQVGDYGIDAQLRRAPFEHWRVCEDGAVEDTYGRLTKVFECSEEDFFGNYISPDGTEASDSFFEKWRRANARRAVPADLPLSHALVAATLAPAIPAGSIMHFGILSSLRNWNYFQLEASVACFSNVAAFGIDGGLSTFIGHSVAAQMTSFLVIGDLSFFYDMNVVGNRHVKSNSRVLLVNNNGGGEFRLYSHPADRFGERADRHIVAAGHNGHARGWVESMGWDYIPVTTHQELSDSVQSFVGESERPILMEVFTKKEDDSAAVKMLREANADESMETRITSALPPGMKRAAGKVLRRLRR